MALTGKNLVVVDEYYDEIAMQIKVECEHLNDVFDSYKRVLTEVCNNAITEGETSEALRAFNNLSNKLSEIPKKIGNSLYLSLVAYPDAVDKADQYLY